MRSFFIPSLPPFHPPKKKKTKKITVKIPPAPYLGKGEGEEMEKFI